MSEYTYRSPPEDTALRSENPTFYAPVSREILIRNFESKKALSAQQYSETTIADLALVLDNLKSAKEVSLPALYLGVRLFCDRNGSSSQQMSSLNAAFLDILPEETSDKARYSRLSTLSGSKELGELFTEMVPNLLLTEIALLAPLVKSVSVLSELTGKTSELDPEDPLFLIYARTLGILLHSYGGLPNRNQVVKDRLQMEYDLSVGFGSPYNEVLFSKFQLVWALLSKKATSEIEVDEEIGIGEVLASSYLAYCRDKVSYASPPTTQIGESVEDIFKLDAQRCLDLVLSLSEPEQERFISYILARPRYQANANEDEFRGVETAVRYFVNAGIRVVDVLQIEYKETKDWVLSATAIGLFKAESDISSEQRRDLFEFLMNQREEDATSPAFSKAMLQLVVDYATLSDCPRAQLAGILNSFLLREVRKFKATRGTQENESVEAILVDEVECLIQWLGTRHYGGVLQTKREFAIDLVKEGILKTLDEISPLSKQLAELASELGSVLNAVHGVGSHIGCSYLYRAIDDMRSGRPWLHHYDSFEAKLGHGIWSGAPDQAVQDVVFALRLLSTEVATSPYRTEIERLFERFKEKLLSLLKEDRGYVAPFIDHGVAKVIREHQTRLGRTDSKSNALERGLSLIQRKTGDWDGETKANFYTSLYVDQVEEILSKGENDVARVQQTSEFLRELGGIKSNKVIHSRAVFDICAQYLERSILKKEGEFEAHASVIRLLTDMILVEPRYVEYLALTDLEEALFSFHRDIIAQGNTSSRHSEVSLLAKRILAACETKAPRTKDSPPIQGLPDQRDFGDET